MDVALEEWDKRVTPQENALVLMENALSCLSHVPGIARREDMVDAAWEFLTAAFEMLAEAGEDWWRQGEPDWEAGVCDGDPDDPIRWFDPVKSSGDGCPGCRRCQRV